MKTSKLSVLFAIVMALPVAHTVVAADLSTPATTAKVQVAGGYLGVLLGPVPDSLRAQLASILPSGEGVMVREVVRNSPAAKAKLEAYDILTDYNDQKIFSAEQLSHMVRASSPDKTVKLRLVRNGAAQDMQVTLGAAQATAESDHPRMEIPMDIHALAPFHHSAGNWESFDSMTLKKLKDGSFKAEIQYFGKDGKLIKQGFTGTRDAIREKIMKQPDIPAAERNQLLQALSARDVISFPQPSVGWSFPDFFNPSWFNGHPYF